MRLWHAVLGLAIGAGVMALVLAGRVGGPAVDGPRVVATIGPLAWAATALGEESVHVLVPAGASPHGYELKPSDLGAIRSADLVVLVGAGFEPAVERVLAKRSREGQRVIRLTDLLPEGESAPEHDHDHAPGEVCTHSHLDPHAWLDPVMMRTLVGEVGEALGASEELIRAAQAECTTIDREYTAAISQLSARRIVTHHNAYGWLAQRYGLTVAAVLQPVLTNEPSPSDLERVADEVWAHGLRAVFIEPQFSPRGAARLRELTGVELMTLDPVGGRDWPKTMRANLAALVSGLGEPAEQTGGDGGAGGVGGDGG